MPLWPGESFVIKARCRRRAGGHVKTSQRGAWATRNGVPVARRSPGSTEQREAGTTRQGAQSGFGFVQTFPRNPVAFIGILPSILKR